MKRRFDASGMRYGHFMASLDECRLRRPSGDDLLVSALLELRSDDFDLRNWKLAVRIGPADEIERGSLK